MVTNKKLQEEILSLKLLADKNENAVEQMLSAVVRLQDDLLRVNKNVLKIYRQKEDNAIAIEAIQNDIAVMRKWIETFRDSLGFMEIETDERNSKSVMKDGSEIIEVDKPTLDSAQTFDNLSDIPKEILEKASLKIQK